MKFTYSNPTAIHFGQGMIAAIAKAIDPVQKVLVIYGGGSIKKNGVYDQVAAALDGRQWQEFSGVEPNPTVETLDRAVAQIRKEGLDYILAVGGGSWGTVVALLVGIEVQTNCLPSQIVTCKGATG